MSYINHKNKLMFIHINKCGGTSVKHAFRNLKNVYIPNNDNIINLIDTPIWNNSTKITIVRNPYNRIKSLYGMLIRQGKVISIDDMLNILMDDSILYKTDNGSLPKGKSYIKRHGLPMTHKHYGICSDDKIIIDKIYKLENIKKDWGKIQKLINHKINLPHKNTSKSDLIKLSELQKDKIQYIYNKDFNLLGYEK